MAGLEARTWDGGSCPVCGSGDLEGSSFETYGNGDVSQDCYCLACYAKWTEVYQLHHCQVVDKNGAAVGPEIPFAKSLEADR